MVSCRSLSVFLVPQTAGTPATVGGISYPFDMNRSWLITTVGLDAGAIRQIGVVLIGLVAIGFGLAGLATVGVLIPTAWWPGLVITSTAAPVLLLALFFSPGTLLGVAIDAVVLWMVLAAVWRPAGLPPCPPEAWAGRASSRYEGRRP